MSGEARQQLLFDALTEELSGAVALRSVLEREAEVLKSLRADALTSVVEEKHSMVVALQDAADRRDAAIAALGFQGDATGVVAFMASDAPSPELLDVWHRLGAEIAVCADLNRHNESLNRGGQRRIQQLLRLLRGEPAEPLTYERLARSPIAGV